MPNLIELIKKAAVEAVAASKPTSVVYGKVISASPLKIQVDQKLTLDDDFLILTRNVTSNTATGTTTDGDHTHSVEVTIDNSLKLGDRVILLMVQGGQSYIVLDKVVQS